MMTHVGELVTGAMSKLNIDIIYKVILALQPSSRICLLKYLSRRTYPGRKHRGREQLLRSQPILCVDPMQSHSIKVRLGRDP
jgi:hypothetical protein